MSGSNPRSGPSRPIERRSTTRWVMKPRINALTRVGAGRSMFVIHVHILLPLFIDRYRPASPLRCERDPRATEQILCELALFSMVDGFAQARWRFKRVVRQPCLNAIGEPVSPCLFIPEHLSRPVARGCSYQVAPPNASLSTRGRTTKIVLMSPLRNLLVQLADVRYDAWAISIELSFYQWRD